MQKETKQETRLKRDLGRLPLMRQSRYRRRLQAFLGKDNNEEALVKLGNEIRAELRQNAARLEKLPRPEYCAELPIVAKRAEIVETIRRHPVVILAGETGSGKTTQIPKFCLEAGLGRRGLIGCTQPRRIAAISVAERIASEMGEEVGQSVGYQIRFGGKTSDGGFIKVMTDGILLAETLTDPQLLAYDAIIIDEAHERSLNIDFLLGYLKNLLKKRGRNLKLIITSATIDTAKFSQAFDDAPIIEVSGRMYPVALEYQPSGEKDDGYVEPAVKAVVKLARETARGDILVFMPTEQDIRETCDVLTGHRLMGVTVMPLFARLSAADQKRVFDTVVGRKVIVATNVAETSLTIPGIKYVVDTGLARISQYSSRTRTTSLPVSPVSQSSCNQRKGRCGRVENGVCIRLFSEEDFDKRPEFTKPEILRDNLAEVILRMIYLKLGDIATFPFVDPPDPRAVSDGKKQLLELGALEKDLKSLMGLKLTPKGRFMAQIPLDPRFSCMLLAAREQSCLDELNIICAFLSIQDPRERNRDNAQAADRAHKAFCCTDSDFVTILNLWRQYQQARKQSNSAAVHFCKANYLSWRRMREWQDIYSQIGGVLKERDMQPQKLFAAGEGNYACEFGGSAYAAIHKAILSGLLSQAAVKTAPNMYRMGNGREVMLFPGSATFNNGGEYMMAAEVVETSRVFARMLAKIEPEWLEEIGGELCKYSYKNPHWERGREQVTADEDVSLFGLIFIHNRPKAYAKIDPVASREIFIRDALVQQDVKKALPFMEHNRELVDGVLELESKLRRRDILVDENDLVQFYSERLSNDIVDMRALAHYLRKQGRDDFLRLNEADLLRYAPDADDLSLFPDNINAGGFNLVVDYVFEPGSEADGVTVKVPLGVSHNVPARELNWGVKGLFAEKVMALIKALPKQYRRLLVPVNETARIMAEDIPYGEGLLPNALSAFVKQRFRLDIPASAWDLTAIPEHLQTRVAIVAPNGAELAAARDLSILKGDVSMELSAKDAQSLKKRWEQDRLTDFPDMEIPAFVQDEHSQFTFFPALVPQKDGKSVALKLLENGGQALETHLSGVQFLYELRFKKDVQFLKRQLGIPTAYKKDAFYFGGVDKVEEALVRKTFSTLFGQNIRTKGAFEALATAKGGEIITFGKTLQADVLKALEAYGGLQTKLSGLAAKSKNAAFFDGLTRDLAQLAPSGFIELYDAADIHNLPRYLNAMGIRAERAAVDFAKDQAKAAKITAYSAALTEMVKSLTDQSTTDKRRKLLDFFWLLEEYKISVFAPEIKPLQPVSPKRLDVLRAEVEAMV